MRGTVYSNRFRERRLQRFLSLVDAHLARAPACRVLDVGGEVDYWAGLEPVWKDRTFSITIVNVDAREVNDPRFRFHVSDARDLSEFPDNSFDIVHSNSVIEHVGRWPDMRRMASEVRRLAPSYFVQTSNFWFPYEPHMRAPFVHWLPAPLQARVVMSRACGFYPMARNVDEAYTILADALPLDATMMRALFPDAQLVRERIGPLTKSLLAIREG